MINIPFLRNDNYQLTQGVRRLCNTCVIGYNEPQQRIPSFATHTCCIRQFRTQTTPLSAAIDGGPRTWQMILDSKQMILDSKSLLLARVGCMEQSQTGAGL